MDELLQGGMNALRLAIENELPGSRERSLALTKLEECGLWVRAAEDNRGVTTTGASEGLPVEQTEGMNVAAPNRPSSYYQQGRDCNAEGVYMDRVRAKFRCVSVNHMDGDSREIKLTAVVGGGPENQGFNKYTPYGNLEMTIDNPAAADFIEPGKEYFLDFTRVEDEGNAQGPPIE